jgi:hypothetical protein
MLKNPILHENVYSPHKLKHSTEIYDYFPDKTDLHFPTTAQPDWNIGDLITIQEKNDKSLCVVLTCKFCLSSDLYIPNVSHAYFEYELYWIDYRKVIKLSQHFLVCDPSKVENDY